MLWEVEIHPRAGEPDNEGARIVHEAISLGASSVKEVVAARSYLIEGDLDQETVATQAATLVSDPVVEEVYVRQLPDAGSVISPRVSTLQGPQLVNVLLKPGVTDNVANTAAAALRDLGLHADRVATCRKYWFGAEANANDIDRVAKKILSNDAIEQTVTGPLPLSSIALGSPYEFGLQTVPIRTMDSAALERLSREGQLYLSLTEMETIQHHFRSLDRDPTDIELETIAQTWSEHCSHKTLAGRIAYRDESGERRFENMLKETIFSATQEIRHEQGDDDWCVSVFKDNAGIVRFDEEYDVCFKVETHNHPSALEPYGGANTGLGGVIRDPLGTGLGAKPICNTDVFCFAPPETSYDDLPQGVLHPRTVLRGVVAGVRDYGNRMGIPTVNGAVYFDERYLGNPLVYCGNVAMLPRGMSEKEIKPGHYIVALGGRTGRDGIHGATFSSAELTHESETLSGGAVQIGNAITEKMLMDVLLEARDQQLFTAVTDCGAGGFSSAVGEMGEETGAEVWLEKAPLKYDGLSYTEIWISEAQERMVLAVPPERWHAFHTLCASEGVEATIIGEFTDTKNLVLKYNGTEVAQLSMEFLHDGRPPVVRDAVYQPPTEQPLARGTTNPAGSPTTVGETLHALLGALNVCSKEWVIRQYDHEVQAGSVVKPLVGIMNDGPSDAAVVRPRLTSSRGLVISCGMNPRFGDLDPYWMAVSAIDEALRNCVAVGADPERIAILDNFCWGNTERPETLGSLVRAALGCHDAAVAFSTPFISGKDSLNNEFSFVRDDGKTETIAIPPSLLISALGQIEDVHRAITMDLKESGNRLYLVGDAQAELGGSHFSLVHGLEGGRLPRVDFATASKRFEGLHRAISEKLVSSCHDVSEGGLAVTVAEMAFAGGLGAKVSLKPLPECSIDESVAALNDLLPGADAADLVALFSESNSRFVVEVPAESADTFEQVVPDAIAIGEVTSDVRVSIEGRSGGLLIDESLDELKRSWQSPLAEL